MLTPLLPLASTGRLPIFFIWQANNIQTWSSSQLKYLLEKYLQSFDLKHLRGMDPIYSLLQTINSEA